MDFQQLMTIIYERLGAKVIVKDLGWTAPGKHQIEIQVGTKDNPAYSPIFNPNVDVLDRTKNPQYIPDRRIISLNGMEDRNKVIEILDVIRKSLPENREIPKIEEMAGMSTGNEYKQAEPVGATMDLPVQPIVNNIPEAPKESDPAIMDALNTIMDTLDSLSRRVEDIESKKKMGRPPKQD